MVILALGDILGIPGIKALRKHLAGVRKMYGADIVVANGENASGIGVSPSAAGEILAAGVDVITLGNHTWKDKDIPAYLERNSRVLRPANYAGSCPGHSSVVVEACGKKICVASLMGRHEINFNLDNPFAAADRIIEQNTGLADAFVVDFHAEATSEKLAMLFYLKGRVSVLFGTHTHIQTADERVVDGTGYITDLGMTGPFDSVIGVMPEQPIEGFLGGVPDRFKTSSAPVRILGCMFKLDDQTMKCVEVGRISIED